MMTTGIISSSQILETKRWDAPYNLAYKEHKETLDELLASMTLDELVEAAQDLPYDAECARVQSGNTRKAYSQWKPDELGLYLILMHKKGHIAGARVSIRNQAAAAEARLSALMTTLGPRNNT
ncbi:MAG: hypothetical protein JSS66_05805 [Armatimonadetes bacterium]|nr:hypothetical protein [Armatimonadota bacterium]